MKKKFNLYDEKEKGFVPNDIEFYIYESALLEERTIEVPLMSPIVGLGKTKKLTLVRTLAGNYVGEWA